MKMNHLAFMLTVVLFTAARAAWTSLFIPGLDPQPLNGVNLGIDEDGHTIWTVFAPTSAGGSKLENRLAGTITLVEGAGYASIVYDNPDMRSATVKSKCTWSSNKIATCTVAQSETTVTTTVPVISCPVQISITALRQALTMTAYGAQVTISP